MHVQSKTYSHIDANACIMNASCTCFMFISVLGFSWPIPRNDKLFTQLCASWECHKHALCLSMTWPCNSPMKSAKLRFSLELLWRELLWWKWLWCSELLCALPALHPTSMRSNGQRRAPRPHMVSDCKWPFLPSIAYWQSESAHLWLIQRAQNIGIPSSRYFLSMLHSTIRNRILWISSCICLLHLVKLC